MKTKAGLFVAALTAVSLLLGASSCEIDLPSDAHLAAAFHSQSHGDSVPEAQISSPKHCSSQNGQPLSHCAIHCHHTGALIVANPQIHADTSPGIVALTAATLTSSSPGSSFRPPILS